MQILWQLDTNINFSQLTDGEEAVKEWSLQ